MGWLGVGREGDIVELAQAQPFPIYRHAEVAEVNGLPGGLRDLVGGGGWGVALRRQVGHDDDSADATITTTTPPPPRIPGKGPLLVRLPKLGTSPKNERGRKKKIPPRKEVNKEKE